MVQLVYYCAMGLLVFGGCTLLYCFEYKGFPDNEEADGESHRSNQ